MHVLQCAVSHSDNHWAFHGSPGCHPPTRSPGLEGNHDQTQQLGFAADAVTQPKGSACSVTRPRDSHPSQDTPPALLLQMLSLHLPFASSASFGSWIPKSSGWGSVAVREHTSSSSHLCPGFLQVLPWVTLKLCCAIVTVLSYCSALSQPWSAIIFCLPPRGFSRALLVFFPNIYLHIHHRLVFFSHLPRQRQQLERLFTSKAFPPRLVCSSKGQAAFLLISQTSLEGDQERKELTSFTVPPKCWG